MLEIIIAVGIAIGVVIVAFTYNHYRNKGVINDDTLRVTNDLLLFARILLSKNIGVNAVYIEKTFEIMRNTIKYLQEQEDVSASEKEQLAIENIIQSLTSIGIVVDYELELLIQIVVENSFAITIKKA